MSWVGWISVVASVVALLIALSTAIENRILESREPKRHLVVLYWVVGAVPELVYALLDACIRCGRRVERGSPR